MPLIKVPFEKRELVTEQKAELLINAAVEWELKALISLEYRTGIRISEALAIEKQDVWKEGSKICIRYRPRKKRKTVMPPQNIIKLRANLALLSYFTAFADSINKRYIFTYSRQKSSAKLKQVFPNGWWHLFRHSCAVRFAENGATPSQLQAWFGWNDIRMAGRYFTATSKMSEPLGEYD